MYVNEETKRVMFTDAETKLLFQIARIDCENISCDICPLNIPSEKTCVRKIVIKAYEGSL